MSKTKQPAVIGRRALAEYIADAIIDHQEGIEDMMRVLSQTPLRSDDRDAAHRLIFADKGVIRAMRKLARKLEIADGVERMVEGND